MNKKIFSLKRWVFFCALPFFLIRPYALSAAGGSGQKTGSNFLQEELSRKKEHLQSGQTVLSALARKENRLYLYLQQVEREIADLSRQIKDKEEGYNQLKAANDELELELRSIGERITVLRTQVAGLLEKLWLLYLQQESGCALGFSSLDEVRLFYTWFSELVLDVQVKLEGLQKQSWAMGELLLHKGQQEKLLAADLRDIKDKHEQLLDKKLEYMQAVRRVRARKLIKEEELARIRQLIQGLEYQIKVQETHRFVRLKGYLPWPARGTVVSHYALHGSAQQQGIGLKLGAAREVRSVSWGKVVFNDRLRGFGQVVIVYHGEHYYSLYAFLQETKVRVGQNLEQGALIGLAGFYPLAKGPGLYFELRKGKQTLDPLLWLRREYPFS